MNFYSDNIVTLEQLAQVLPLIGTFITQCEGALGYPHGYQVKVDRLLCGQYKVIVGAPTTQAINTIDDRIQGVLHGAG